jgi:dihydropteroate synthase
VEGTAATVAIGIERGADIIRVHDVKVMARVARMTDAIVKS